MDRLYTDEEISDLSGLHIDTIRKAVVFGAVKPARGGRGRNNKRMWSIDALLRLVPIAALKNAGYSLQLAHTISFIPQLHSELYIFHPAWISSNGASDDEGWWDPAAAEVKPSPRDFRIVVVNSAWVFFDYVRGYNIINADGSPMRVSGSLAGRINPSGTKLFVPNDWSKFYYSTDKNGVIRSFALWEGLNTEFNCVGKSLVWQYDPSIDSASAIQSAIDLRQSAGIEAYGYEHGATYTLTDEEVDEATPAGYRMAEDAYRRPTSVLDLNIGLNLRIAMRRALGLRVDYPGVGILHD